ERGAIAERTELDPGRLAHAASKILINSDLQLGPRADAAAQNDDFGIKDGMHGKDRCRDDPADLVDRDLCRLVGREAIEDVAHRAAGAAAQPALAADDAGAADR